MPERIRGLNCGSFYLWHLVEDPGQVWTPITYCTARSSNSPPAAESSDPNAIAAQGTDCVGHWAECTIFCEQGDQRVWIEDIPRTGYGLSCADTGIMEGGAEDCTVGDGA